jgi:hypothetical protein
MDAEKPQEVRYDGLHCNMIIQPLSRRVLVLRISGTDIGEFGEAPMLELNKYLTGANPVELFIDARDVRGASIDVSGDWAKWLSAQKAHLRDVNMLTGSRFVAITADFVRRFADLQGVMRIYTEPAAFDAVLAESLERQ